MGLETLVEEEESLHGTAIDGSVEANQVQLFLRKEHKLIQMVLHVKAENPVQVVCVCVCF